MGLSTSQRRERNASYVPLVITAALRCGVISDGLLPIDGILYYAQHREARPGNRVMARSRESAILGGPQDKPLILPLKRLNGLRPEWYYAASCARWPSASVEGTDYWVKRTDSRYADLVETTSRVPISGGRYRAYRIPIVYRHALAVSWSVVGEPAAIRRLLALVSHIGKKAEMGWGAVSDWRVEHTEHDESTRTVAGALTRPVPSASGVLFGYRPPYWHPRNQAPCELPGDQ